ncbi:MAG: arginine decarboxylase, partial [Clostridiales bacterium]|nr:arginine decarboxylase [Clostridiales bacterium]
EFGDLGNFLAYISIGDKTKNIERLIGSLAEIRRLYKREQAAASQYRYHTPEVVLTPQEAFYAPRKSVPLDEGIGHVCCEFFMTYPPGIPLLAPGERITEDIIGYIRSARDLGCVITGPQHLEADRINILTGEG